MSHDDLYSHELKTRYRTDQETAGAIFEQRQKALATILPQAVERLKSEGIDAKLQVVGSTATGEAGPESDIDVNARLETDRDEAGAYGRLRAILTELGEQNNPPLHFHVWKPGEFAAMKLRHQAHLIGLTGK